MPVLPLVHCMKLNCDLLSKKAGLLNSPYIVGRWVCGPDHYDRQSLIEYLLNAQDTAIWVVGTRRMGKTSLLRQLEMVTDNPHSHYLPLFWDLQGCTSTDDLSKELHFALEDAAERFVDFDVDLESLSSEDAVTILRRLNRALRKHTKRLLLLVDEAEVLIEIANIDASWLARMRKALQEGHQRTIIVSTKFLSQLTDQSTDWVTSPFLFGFHMVNLRTLKQDGAACLVRQTQANHVVEVDDEVLEDILRYTNHHPFLIQYLCQRLYVQDGESHRYLRPVTEADLVIDHPLASFFQLDYQRLTNTERQILLAVAEAKMLSQEAVSGVVAQNERRRLPSILNSLQELGHLGQFGERWGIGNEFLLRWTRENLPHLKAELERADESEPVRNGDETIEAAARSLGVSSHRVKSLADMQISTEQEFFAAIKNIFYEIRHLVEQDDGHKLLITVGENDTPVLRSEEEVQVALKHWLRPLCRAMNVQLARESLTGRGFLDFKFSIGHDLRCLAEVKLFSSSRLQDGVGIQLPTYMLADKTKYGVYVPIFLDSPDYAAVLQDLKDLASARAQSHSAEIAVVDIRAWKPPPASRADGVEDSERYHVAYYDEREQDGNNA